MVSGAKRMWHGLRQILSSTTRSRAMGGKACAHRLVQSRDKAYMSRALGSQTGYVRVEDMILTSSNQV